MLPAAREKFMGLNGSENEDLPPYGNVFLGERIMMRAF